MIAAAMGWIGTIGSISAYLLLSRGHWASSSLRFSALNCVAGLLSAFASGVYGAWPSVTSNLLWAAIAAHSAIITLRARHTAARLASVTALPVVDHDPPTGPQPVLVTAA